jgi:hypothetical protein
MLFLSEIVSVTVQFFITTETIPKTEGIAYVTLITDTIPKKKGIAYVTLITDTIPKTEGIASVTVYVKNESLKT